VKLQFDPLVVKDFFTMLSEYPEVIDAKRSMDLCLEGLKIAIDSIAVKNIFKKNGPEFPSLYIIIHIYDMKFKLENRSSKGPFFTESAIF
jgi:hypothetical protein